MQDSLTTRGDGASPQRTFLSRALLENALVTALLGAVLLLGAAQLDTWLGVNVYVLVAVGLGLIGYALELTLWARSSQWLRSGGKLAVAGDTVALIGAIGTIAFTDVLTNEGEIALALIAAVIATFVVLQSIWLAKLEETY